MYAIIEVGAKQFQVKKGDKLAVEKIEAEAGTEITVKDVLMVADGDTVHIGQPLVKNATVIAKVLGQGKGDKVLSFKYRRRKASHTTKGHRQKLTNISIEEIKVS
jgi:large subunit ribosomal protein L21